MKSTVTDLLRQQNLKNFPKINAGATIKEALLAFKQHDSSTVLIMQGQSLVGLFTEKDYAKASLASEGCLSLDTKVADLMARKIVYVTPEYQLDECLAVLNKLNIRALPVMKDKKPIALLSMRNIMWAQIQNHEFTIDQLVRYVTNTHFQEPEEPPKAVVKTYSHEQTGSN